MARSSGGPPPGAACRTEALTLAREGYRVLPLHSVRDGRCSCGEVECASPGKHPRLPHGVREASCDLAQVEAWWRQWPEASVGLATGPNSGVRGLWVLDLDVKVPRRDGEPVPGALDGLSAWTALLEERGELPPLTARAETGSGGAHLLWAWPADGRRVRNRAAIPIEVDGVLTLTAMDARGEGGYIVAPPSPHVSGRTYAWVRSLERGLVEAPDWLLDLVAPLRRPAPALEVVSGGGADDGDRCRRYALADLRSACQELAACPEGGRNALAVRLAHRIGGLLRYLPEGEAERALTRAAMQAGLTEREASGPIRRGLASGAAEPRQVPDRPAPPRADRPPVPPLEVLEAELLPAPPSARSGRVEAPTAARASTAVSPPVQAPAARLEGSQGPPREPGEEDPDEGAEGRPQVRVGGRQLREVVGDAWAGLCRMRGADGAPLVYRQGVHLVQVRRSPAGASVQTIEEAAHLLPVAAELDWVTEGRHGLEPVAAPPQAVLSCMVHGPSEALPVLDGLVSAPCYCPAEDGGAYLLSAPGYHPRARVLYVGSEYPRRSMTRREALRLLLQEWLVDFPFARESDRSHALGLYLAPFVRRLVTGPAPAAVIEAPVQGSGKSLLAEVLSTVALGAPPVPTPLSPVPEERRKALLAALRSGRGVLLLDNLQGLVADPTLEGMLTAYPYWTDRDLGAVRELTVSTAAQVVLTSNNARLSPDLARRCVAIRLDARTDRPAERQDFRVADIRRWTREHRRDLVAAALALVEGWLGDGRPYGGHRLGSYERWSEVVGGVVTWAGREPGWEGLASGWLQDRGDFAEAADQLGTDLRALVATWAADIEAQRGAPGRTAEWLVAQCLEQDLLLPQLGDRSERAMQTAMGALLAGVRGQVWTLGTPEAPVRWTYTGPLKSGSKRLHQLERGR